MGRRRVGQAAYSARLNCPCDDTTQTRQWYLHRRHGLSPSVQTIAWQSEQVLALQSLYSPLARSQSGSEARRPGQLCLARPTIRRSTIREGEVADLDAELLLQPRSATDYFLPCIGLGEGGETTVRDGVCSKFNTRVASAIGEHVPVHGMLFAQPMQIIAVQ